MERARTLATYWLTESRVVGSEGPGHSSPVVRAVSGHSDAPGEEGAALLRARELGCLPEAALALVILTDYRLVGPAHDGGILQIEPDWPAAWRVHAARCHRALAAGCRDDIDLLMRIFSEWQRSPDPNGWCATWWVDPATLHQIESDVAAVFAGLATTGPIGMRHPVDPARGPQVRMALAEAYSQLELVRVGPSRYRSALELRGEPFSLSPAVLVSPGDRVIAMRRNVEFGGVEHLIDPENATAAPVDLLAPVRGLWPVGSIVDIETLGSGPAGRYITNLVEIQRGFPYPHGSTPSLAHSAESVPELTAAPAYAGAPIDTSPKVRVRVTGYRTEGDRTAVLVVDPLEPGAPIDPSDQPDLATWDDIEVVVRGLTAAHHGSMLELARVDGLGSFFVDPAAGLDASDHGFAARLAQGARLPGRVVPEPPTGRGLTVSLLPIALRHLQRTVTNEHEPVPAIVVARDPTRNTITVELEHRDTASGMSHRFTFGVDRLGTDFDPAPGGEVDVVLRPDRSPQRRRLRSTPELVRLAERNHDTFLIEHGWLGLRPSPPQIPAILALLSLSDSSVWEREVVWMYEDNLHLEVAVAGPRGSSPVSEAAASSPGFLLPAPVRTAASVAETTDATPRPEVPLSELPRIVAWLPPGAPERVIGADGVALAELRAGPGVVSVDLENDIVTVVGQTGRAVRSAVSEIQRLILPAKGKVIVPPGQGKRLIGIDGTTLRAIQGRTGCVGRPPREEGDLWTVEGPSSQAVKEFIRLAAEQVAGVIGRVTDVEDLEVLEDTTIPGGMRRSHLEEPPGSSPDTTPAPPSPAPPVGDRRPKPEAPVAAPRSEAPPPAARTPQMVITPRGQAKGRKTTESKPHTRSSSRRDEIPKIRTGPGPLGWLGRAALVLVAALLVAAALLYLLPLVSGADSGPPGNDSSLGPATTAITTAPTYGGPDASPGPTLA